MSRQWLQVPQLGALQEAQIPQDLCRGLEGFFAVALEGLEGLGFLGLSLGLARQVPHPMGEFRHLLHPNVPVLARFMSEVEVVVVALQSSSSTSAIPRFSSSDEYSSLTAFNVGLIALRGVEREREPVWSVIVVRVLRRLNFRPLNTVEYIVVPGLGMTRTDIFLAERALLTWQTLFLTW